MREFKDKIAVVTGAASGIGRAIADRCVNEGMKVVLADIEEEALLRAEKQLKDMGAETLSVVTDISKEADIRALAQKRFRHLELCIFCSTMQGWTPARAAYCGKIRWQIGSG